jgi:hypothetical protein
VGLFADLMATKQKLNVATTNLTNMLFNTRTQDVIVEMISKGWGFSLNYSDIPYDESIEGFVWEADFYKRKDGLFDNFKSGYHPTDPNEAIRQAKFNALNNIKD